jgi:SWI/SNF-related matrix-associated actin-dependent regulator of chromatin subfamily A member 5
MMIDDDIDAIISRGEERTVELNSKYETLNLEDLSNFKSDASVQQWEGEDFRGGVSLRSLRALGCSPPPTLATLRIDTDYESI